MLTNCRNCSAMRFFGVKSFQWSRMWRFSSTFITISWIKTIQKPLRSNTKRKWSWILSSGKCHICVYYPICWFSTLFRNQLNSKMEGEGWDEGAFLADFWNRQLAACVWKYEGSLDWLAVCWFVAWCNAAEKEADSHAHNHRRRRRRRKRRRARRRASIVPIPRIIV